MGTTKTPIRTEEIFGPDGRVDSLYFRFREGAPARSVQPDPSRPVFLEVAQDGLLIGVLTFESVDVLLLEHVGADIVLDPRGHPLSVGDCYRYDVQFDTLRKDRVLVRQEPCGA